MERKRIAVEEAVIIAVQPVDIDADAALHPDQNILCLCLPERFGKLGDKRPDHAFPCLIRAFIRPEIPDNHIIAANRAVPVNQIGKELLAFLSGKTERLSRLKETAYAAERPSGRAAAESVKNHIPDGFAFHQFPRNDNLLDQGCLRTLDQGDQRIGRPYPYRL